jgi:hypothetical protein
VERVKIALRMMLNMGVRGLIWGGAVGMFAGFCFGLPVFIIGGIIGLIWGGGMGARVGLTTGLLMAFITYRYFYPLKVDEAEHYILICRLACPTLAAASTVIFAVLSSGSMSYLYMLPAILAAVAALPLSQSFIRWYMQSDL